MPASCPLSAGPDTAAELHPIGRLSGWELLAAAITFLLPVVFLPSLSAPFWAPKAALVLVLAGLTAPLLLAPVPPSLRTTRLAGVGLVVVAAASTALASQPLMAVVGNWNWGTGFIFVLSLAGAWALGLRVRPHARLWIERAFLGAVAANVLAVYIQASLDLEHLSLGRIDGRPVGLLGNPVHVGTLLVCGLVLILPRFRAQPLRWLLPLVALGGAVQIVGGRFAAVGVAVIIMTALWVWGWRPVGGAAACLVAGFLLVASPALWFEAETSGDVVTLTSRAEAEPGAPGGGSLTPRMATWWSARHAVLDRPLFGHGPGRFGAATGPYRPAELVADGGRTFKDAHNIVVEYMVTTGLVGLAALVAFVASAARSAERSVLLGVAAVIGIALLIQPQTVGLTPLLFLALGASSAAAVPAIPTGLRLGVAGSVGVATLAALALLLGSFRLSQADLDFRLSDGRAADAFLRPFPQPALRLATIEQFRAISGVPRASVSADAWLAEAIRRDPLSVASWLRRAEYAESRMMFALAERCYRTALELDPLSASASAGLARLAR